MSLKLNQVIAITSGEKSRKEKELTKYYQNLKRETLFDGIIKTYKPLDEDGLQFPDEKKLVQRNAKSELNTIKAILANTYNMVGTLDAGNCDAKADIKIDEETIVKDVPVTTLIFLEKQIVDLATVIGALPVLDPAEEWEYSSDAGCYKSKPKDAFRQEKIRKNHVKAEATKEHPAQVEIFTEDHPVGTWTTIKLSGNISQTEKDDMVKKIVKLKKAIIMAREEANSREVKKSSVGEDVINYLFS